MKFLIVEPSLLPVLTPLGAKYLPQDLAFIYSFSLCSFFAVRDHVSQRDSATGNIIIYFNFQIFFQQ